MIISNVTCTLTNEYEFAVAVVFTEDTTNEVVMTGETSVCVETEEEAIAYANDVFLPDLRANFTRKIGSLVLPWETSFDGGEQSA